MKTLHRYGCLLLSFSLFFLWHWVFSQQRNKSTNWSRGCSMYSCFNFSRCSAEKLRVYVYPDILTEELSPSVAYSKILRVIRESAFYTEDPEKACLLILNFDTTDRDPRSEKNYIHGLRGLVAALPENVWKRGENHVIFNLYHGTYPDYADHNLGFPTGKAIVARASASAQHFRHGFDLSLPLFHEEHPVRDSIQRSFSLSDKDPLLASFKGKRYVYGIGSETRDSLHHLHNDQSDSEMRVAMLTTCRHNHDWQAHQDERCEADNREYDKYDYEGLMVNSSFCLTPRGRRLGSYRFLESLRVGCIPVVLSDDWQLPFAEVIDWSAAVVRVHEKNVLFVTDILSSFPRYRIRQMKQRARLLYYRYFASVEKIALTTLKIIWQRASAAIAGLPTPAGNSLLPFQLAPSNEQRRITVVVRSAERQSTKLQATIHKIASWKGLEKVIVAWPKSRGDMPVGADFGLPHKVRIRIVRIANKTDLPYADLFSDEKKGHTVTSRDTVLFLSDSSTVTTEELTRMAEIHAQRQQIILTRDAIDWQSIPSEEQAGISYNIALLHTAFVHRWYLEELHSFLPASLVSECPTASLSLMVSSLSLSPPLLFSSSSSRPVPSKWDTRNEHMCMAKLAKRWTEGPLPLLASTIRVR